MSDKFVKALRSSAQAPMKKIGVGVLPLGSGRFERECQSFNVFSFHHILGRIAGADNTGHIAGCGNLFFSPFAFRGKVPIGG